MPILFHTVLVAAHVLAVAIGLGAALLADAIALRLLVSGPVARRDAARIHDLSGAVSAGLALLWLTGAVLVWYDQSINPAFILNQKVWAKVAIVLALTVNAVLLHRVVLPMIERQQGRRLFAGVSWQARGVCAFAGSVSVVSWLSALTLGLAKELNGVVTFLQVMEVYVVAVMATWAGSAAALSFLSPKVRARIA